MSKFKRRTEKFPNLHQHKMLDWFNPVTKQVEKRNNPWCGACGKQEMSKEWMRGCKGNA